MATLLAPELIARLERDWTQLTQIEARLATLRRARRVRVIQGTDRVAPGPRARGAARDRAARRADLGRGAICVAPVYEWSANRRVCGRDADALSE